MKAYMIADLNNPVSVRYTEIALESWSKQDILDIEVIQCYTPDTIADLEPLYNWQPLLHGMQMGKMSSPSERAGDISHWQLIKKRAESDARFYVMEHDSYLLDADEFKRQYDFTMRHGLVYANSGLFMSCYTLSKSAAVYMNDLLLNRKFPLNGGPYGCIERLVKTYLSDYHERTYWEIKDWGNEPYEWMCHHPNLPHVNIGRTSEELRDTYNYPAKESPFKLASTQVISKSFGITQEHNGMKKSPWKRIDGFKIID
jgi:hypothetical protein